MNEYFQSSLEFVLAHEGGLVDHPADPGGVTNYGISLRLAVKLGHIDMDGDGVPDLDFDEDGDIDADDIRALTPERAGAVYRWFWTQRRFGLLGDHLVAAKLFDLFVVMGFRQQSLVAQRALRACGCPVVEDGIMGRNTFAEINRFQRSGPPWRNTCTFLPAVASEAAGFFRQLRKPEFEEGWLNRAYHQPEGYPR